MLSEHNPIAELIHQIQQKWMADVSPFPHLKLVRWLIKPEEARLYEGFLKLESTEHGVIPEVLVAMLSPFKDESTYARDLMRDWVKAFEEDKKAQEKLAAKGNVSKWNPALSPAHSIAENEADQRFVAMLSSFHREMMDKDTRLVVALFPYTIHDMAGFRRWLKDMLKSGLPAEITFMIFDHVGENYYDQVFEKYSSITKSLHLNLDLDGAVSKLAKMGDPGSPEVQFRECILEMGQAVQKGNQATLHHWGERALQVTQRSGLKSLYASAHIVYAGMLFHFKQFAKIDALLLQGFAIARKGLQTEGEACRPLVMQHQGYIAASRQLQKKIPEAVEAYEKQGDFAVEYGLAGMALTPYYQAYTLTKKSQAERYGALIKKAFSAGLSMHKEEQANSNFAAIAADYLQWLKGRQQWEEAKQTDDTLKTLLGDDWPERVKRTQASYPAAIQEPVIAN